MAVDSGVPFRQADELVTKLTDHEIPAGTAGRLGDELSCAVLDELYPNLDFVARKSSLHIDPIHRHLQKGRKIILTEDPSLHLVWYYGIIYAKPLPPYLLSYSFWNEYLGPGSTHRAEALGFVRSYERLIRHPSDFALAQDARLIPSSSSPSSSPSPSPPLAPPQPAGELTYSALSAFLHHFSDIPDPEVSPRWRFGQLRLSRLNWAVRILQPGAASRKGFLHRVFYEEQFWQTGQFLNDFAAPLLFVFAALSLTLSSMQVALAAKSFDQEGGWHIFGVVSAWFSVLVIIVLGALFVGLGAATVGVWAWQLQFSYRSWKRSAAETKATNVEAGRGVGRGRRGGGG